MNEPYIKVCPYCERYRRCPWSETCAASVPVEQRKEIARLCLQDIEREEAQHIYNPLSSVPPIIDGFECCADSGLFNDLPF